jgi:hypothetical protein
MGLAADPSHVVRSDIDRLLKAQRRDPCSVMDGLQSMWSPLRSDDTDALRGCQWPRGDWMDYHAAAPRSLLNESHPWPVNAYRGGVSNP